MNKYLCTLDDICMTNDIRKIYNIPDDNMSIKDMEYNNHIKEVKSTNNFPLQIPILSNWCKFIILIKKIFTYS